MWTPYSRWVGDDVHGWHTSVIAQVWIDLPDLVARQPDEPTRTVIDGIDLDWRVKGRLTGWWRTHRGDWMGVVNYEVPYADGGRNRIELRDQLLPARLLTFIEYWDGGKSGVLKPGKWRLSLQDHTGS